MSSHCPFRLSKLLTAFAAAGMALLMPASVLLLQAQTAQPPQQAALSDNAKAGPEKKQQCGYAAAIARGCGQPGGAKGRHRQGHRQGQGSREIGRRHLQPRSLPAAEGRLQIDGFAAARREQAGRRSAGRDHRLRLVIDRRLRRDLAGIQLSQPARGAVAPAVSDRRHHRHQSRPGRRGRARNDEAAADLGHRHASGSGDLAGRHQCGAAQPRSGRDRQARRRRHHAHSGCGRRHRADRSAIFAARSTNTRKAPAR